MINRASSNTHRTGLFLVAGILIIGGLALFFPGAIDEPASAQTVGFSTRITDNNKVGLTTTNYGFYGNNFSSISDQIV